MDRKLLDYYTDYLISSTSQTTATGLSKVLCKEVSHDKFTRFLSSEDFSSKELWHLVKKSVRKIELEEGILVFDDTISEKPHTDENSLISWHYDHSKGRSVKGINLLSGLYVGKQDIALPIGYELIIKDLRDEKGKRKSLVSKNELMRGIFSQAITNQLKFKWVITDIWFGSRDNMKFIKEKGKEFIMPLKRNRKVALSATDKKKGQYVPINSLPLEPGTCLEVYLEKTPFPITLIKEEYVNKDKSTGELYLVCSDLTATFQQIITLYQKRWRVEEYHKSLKNNASLESSPTRTVRTQSNHLFMSLIGYCKLELFKMMEGLNHFALKARLYTKAIMAAMAEMKRMTVGVQLEIDFA